MAVKNRHEVVESIMTMPIMTMPSTEQEAVLWFGQMLLRHFSPEKQYTVAEWIDHVIDSKAAAGKKRKTISAYRFCAIRIKQMIGAKQLSEVRPIDISNLFLELRKETVKSETRAVVKPNVNLTDILARGGKSKTGLAAAAGISESTLDRAIHYQRVLLTKAEAIASALDYQMDEIFETVSIEKPLTHSTLQDYRRFVALVFSVAERELLIPYNPVSRAEIPMPPKRRKISTLQPDEVQAVWAAAEQEPIDKRCLLHMFLITGCRRGEIAGLRWSSVLWDYNALLIDHTVLYTPEDGTYYEEGTKTGQDRLIRLPYETIELLREYKIWQNAHKAKLGNAWIESDYIFTALHGGPICPETISGYIARFQERYHLPPIHPHKFRHTMASILIYAGMDIVTVAKRLGHAQVSTTVNMYADLILKADMESADCIADAIFHGEKLK